MSFFNYKTFLMYKNKLKKSLYIIVIVGKNYLAHEGEQNKQLAYKVERAKCFIEQIT